MTYRDISVQCRNPNTLKAKFNSTNLSLNMDFSIFSSSNPQVRNWLIDFVPIYSTETLIEDSNCFYGVITHIKDKCMKLFIGSQVAAEAGFPDEQELKKILIQQAEAKCKPPEKLSPMMPLPKLVEIIGDSLGRATLIKFLNSVDSKRGRNECFEKGVYPIIPHLPRSLFKVVFTMEWHSLLRRAFEFGGLSGSVKEVYSDSEAADADIVNIYKLGGDLGDFGKNAIFKIPDLNIASLTMGAWNKFLGAVKENNFAFIGVSEYERSVLFKHVLDKRDEDKKYYWINTMSIQEEGLIRSMGFETISTSITYFFDALHKELED